MQHIRKISYVMVSVIMMAVPGMVGAQFAMPPSGGLPTGSIYSLIGRTMNWLLAVFGMIAIIAFVISGFQYLTAAGDEGQIETAKRNMKYSIIGIVVALSGWIILAAIYQALAGNPFF